MRLVRNSNMTHTTTMKNAFTILTLGLAASALAQPTLTFTGNAPQPGTSYVRHFSPYIAPGPAGAGQTWDFSQLTTDSTATVNLVDPATTAFGVQFPTATVAEVSDGSTIYFRADISGVHLLGYEAEGLPVPFGDDGRFMDFPCSLQTSWTDNYSGTFEVDGTDVELSGSISATADGHGTLIMPGGNTTGVLRVHWVQEEQMDMGMFSFTSVYDNHLYYLPGRSYPLVQTISATSTVFGNSTTTEFTQWTPELATGMQAVTNASSLNAFPVPTSGDLNFTLPEHFSGTPLISISDVTGRTVSGARNLELLGDRGHIDVSALPAGAYQCTAIDELGQRASARFTVQ